MDVRNLRQIIAIQQHGSFAKAAEALGLAQPSLSKSIARLEDQLKVRIFDRSAAGSALTPIGELIVQRAERVIAETRDLMRDAALVAGGDAGTVRLGVATFLRTTFLPRLMLHIADQHPKLRLHVELGSSDRLLPHLETRELDLVLCAQPRGLPGSPLVYQEIIRAQTAIVASPDHPLAAQSGLTVGDLSKFKCAGTAIKGFTNAELLGGEEDNLGAYTTNDYDAFLPLACAGEAVLVAPSFVVQPFLADGRLVELDIEWSLEVGFGAVTTHAVSFSPVLSKIARYAHDIGAQIQAEWPGLGRRSPSPQGG